jgi:hypothetical protein
MQAKFIQFYLVQIGESVCLFQLRLLLLPAWQRHSQVKPITDGCTGGEENQVRSSGEEQAGDSRLLCFQRISGRWLDVVLFSASRLSDGPSRLGWSQAQARLKEWRNLAACHQLLGQRIPVQARSAQMRGLRLHRREANRR